MESHQYPLLLSGFLHYSLLDHVFLLISIEWLDPDKPNQIDAGLQESQQILFVFTME